MDTMTLLSYLLQLIVALFGVGGDALVSVPSAATTTALVREVVDGDTIRVRLATGEEATVRYIGIDTPEPYRDGEPACGALEATAMNEQLVAGQTVTLVADAEDRDRFDRLLRYVYVDETLINEVLVRDGYATSLAISPNTRFADRFADYEAVAVRERRGIWAACEAI